MSDTEYAWCAGFFDGEGCVGSQRVNRNFYPYATIGQVDRWVLDRFQKAVGVGKVYGPYIDTSNKNKQPVFHYKCTGKEDVERVFNLLQNDLSPVKFTKFVLNLALTKDNIDTRQRITPVEVEAVRNMLNEGLKTSEIAEEMGWKLKRVQYVASRYKLHETKMLDQGAEDLESEESNE